MDFCLLLKILVKILVKTLVKTYAVHIARNFLIMLNNQQQMHLKLLQKSDLKKAEATGDLIGNKMANKVKRASKNSQQNNSETVTNENNKEIPKERYISRRKTENYWWSKIDIIV